MPEIAEHLAAEHDGVLAQAWQLCDPYLIIHGRPRGSLWPFGRKRLTTAVACFQRVLEINPGNWQSHWGLGKIYQRLKDYPKSLRHFSAAAEMCTDNENVGREAAMVACECGSYEKAVGFALHAVSVKPDNPGLHANHALVLCFAGRDAEAAAAVEKSLSLNPHDPISQRVRSLITRVASGDVHRPRDMREAEKCL